MNKKTETKKSTNLRNGKFKAKELKEYNLNDKEIEVVLQYQELLPILQEEGQEGVNTRILHEQLKLSRQYDKWTKNVCEQLDLEEGIDIKSLKTISKNQDDGRPKLNHFVNLETAKEIAMIAGVGNRINQETKEISKITRKYFIYIEKAFKQRYNWNEDRDSTLIKCKVLKRAIITNKDELDKTRQRGWNNFMSEFCLLNEVIIGMSAKQYRAINNLKDSCPIRNIFNEKQLELVHILEQYDADLITVQNEFSWDKRKEYLSKKLKMELGISA